MRFFLMSVFFVVLLVFGGGCQQETVVNDTTVLMAVGQREVRLDEFQRSYRVFRSAYGEGGYDDPVVERASKIRFLQQMADQLVLMAYAHDIGVAISDDDLNKAIEEIRSDYPDELFDQMLLENAINFEHWKESLRVRLVIDQLVQKELSRNIQITEEDIANYYQNNTVDRIPPDTDAAEKEADQRLVQQLRHQKAEQAFGPWIEALRVKYPVTIDEEAVSRIIAESELSAHGDESDANSN